MAAGNLVSKTFSNAAPTSAAAVVLAANPLRTKATFVNAGTQIVYLGKDATITTGTGIPVYPNGGGFTDDGSHDSWSAVVVSGTGDLRIVEYAQAN